MKIKIMYKYLLPYISYVCATVHPQARNQDDATSQRSIWHLTAIAIGIIIAITLETLDNFKQRLLRHQIIFRFARMQLQFALLLIAATCFVSSSADASYSSLCDSVREIAYLKWHDGGPHLRCPCVVVKMMVALKWRICHVLRALSECW